MTYTNHVLTIVFTIIVCESVHSLICFLTHTFKSKMDSKSKADKFEYIGSGEIVWRAVFVICFVVSFIVTSKLIELAS